MPYATRVLLLLACGALSGLAAAAPSAKPNFTLADLASLVHLSRPVLNPDGTQVALLVSRPDLANNRLVTTLVMVDAKTGAQRMIASGDLASPAFSSTGDLAWLAADADHVMQINVLPRARANEALAAVTHAEKGTGVQAFSFSPDGQSLAYLAPQPAAAKVGDARFDRTFETPEADYLGTSYLARSSGGPPARLWVTPVAGGSPRLMTPNSDHLVDLVWQADGKSVLLSAHPGASDISSRFGTVSAVEVATGSSTTVVPEPANVASEYGMRMSSQGSLAYQHYRGQDPWLYNHNVAVVRGGSAHDATTALDRDITAFDWLPDGNTLLVQALEHLRSAFWVVPQSGPARRIDLGEVDLGSFSDGFSVAAHRAVVAFIASEPNLPPELYVMASLNGKPLRLTNFNSAVLGARLGKMQAVSWTSDGYDQDGVLTLPPDFHPGQRYPLLVSIHGGPHTSSQLAFDGAGQFYAASGWLVFEPNYRGSSGQGEKYRTAVIGDPTAGPGRDIRAGIDAVKALGIVDESRVAVTGYSYGGVMTSWMIGHHHDWCAAIPGGSVVDFADYYDQSETGIWIGSLLGSPHLPGNREKYVQINPATYLDQATTPTLVLQNVGDPNATIGQAYTLFHALKDRGIKSRFIVSEVDSHDHGDPFHERQAYVLTLGWMTENCAPK